MNTDEAVNRIEKYIDAQLAIGWSESNDLVFALRHVIREAMRAGEEKPVTPNEILIERAKVFDLTVRINNLFEDNQKLREKIKLSDISRTTQEAMLNGKRA